MSVVAAATLHHATSLLSCSHAHAVWSVRVLVTAPLAAPPSGTGCVRARRHVVSEAGVVGHVCGLCVGCVQWLTWWCMCMWLSGGTGGEEEEEEEEEDVSAQAVVVTLDLDYDDYLPGTPAREQLVLDYIESMAALLNISASR